MGACSHCCYSWCKRNPKETSADPFVNPPTPTNHPTQISSTQPSSTPPLSISKKPPEEVIGNFDKIDTTCQEVVFIRAIKEILERNIAQKHTQDTSGISSSHTDKLSNLESFTQDSFFPSEEATKIAGSMLEKIGHLHWAVAGHFSIGYLVSKCAKVSQNRTECLELLQEMLKLVSHIKDLNNLIIEEKELFEKALQCIIGGKNFSFLKSTVNSETLTAIRYPSNTVGIEDQLKAINELHNIENMEDCSSIAVVIWGLGGIGKTTLAKDVVSTVDRNYKEMQQKILKDAFIMPCTYKTWKKFCQKTTAANSDRCQKTCEVFPSVAEYLFFGM